MARRDFSLNNLREGISQRYEELAHSDSSDADIRSLDDMSEGRFQPFTYQQEDFDRTEAPKDAMRKYWRQYETTPVVRKPISSFASQVMEPGYYLESTKLGKEDLNKLRHWLERAAIIEGMPGKDWRLLAKKSIIQREVRGSALIEKAPDTNDEDKIAGLKLINPETVEAVTRPGQSILLAPEDNDNLDQDDLPSTSDGEAAAYLQDISETDALFGTPVRRNRVENTKEARKIAFTRNEIVKLTRDADVGDIFGTSRIESVSDRIEGLQHKLQDNDEAIASKAYPLWLFYFGGDGDPIWDSDDIDDFMSAYEMENFHPGQKQGVRGDVSVDTISGEVAEIAEYLEFDIDWIMSAMPMPKFALGAFGNRSVGQIGGIAQQRDVQRQIQEARRELENEFTPLIREVAQQQGWSEEMVDDLRLKIGEPGQEEQPIGTNEQIIRYVSGANQGNQQPSDGNVSGTPSNVQQVGPGGEPVQTGPQTSRGSNQSGGGVNENPFGINPSDKTPKVDTVTGPPEEAGAGAYVWNESNSIAELSLDNSRKKQVADAIFSTLQKARDGALSEVSEEYGREAMYTANYFENVANSASDRALRKASLRSKVRPALREEIVEYSSGSKFTSQLNVKHFSQNVENATRDAMDELMRKMRVQIRHGVEDSNQFDDIRSRIESKYNDSNLRQRAELIAHMEMKNATETTKLQQWEQSSEVVGVRVHNPDPKTPLTQSLDGVEAHFTDTSGIDEQLMEETRKEFLHEGFNPLPTVPPFHYQDKTTFEPIEQ